MVGSASRSDIGSSPRVQFAVATSLAYKDKDGTPIYETTWLNVSAWSDKPERADAVRLEKGDRVEVEGRLRAFKYTDAQGNERASYEVIAQRVRILDEARLDPQML